MKLGQTVFMAGHDAACSLDDVLAQVRACRACEASPEVF